MVQMMRPTKGLTEIWAVLKKPIMDGEAPMQG